MDDLKQKGKKEVVSCTHTSKQEFSGKPSPTDFFLKAPILAT